MFHTLLITGLVLAVLYIALYMFRDSPKVAPWYASVNTFLSGLGSGISAAWNWIVTTISSIKK